MKVAVLADIGQPVYHVGDEAIAHAATNELRTRGVHDLVLLSRDPAQSRVLHETDSARTLEFPWPPLERERYLDEIHRVLNGEQNVLPSEDQLWDLLGVIESSDAVLIAGGGNLNSTYGWLLYERAAVAAIARHFGKPLVVSGQTLGPTLTTTDATLLGNFLGSAQLVGVRESRSYRLALDLGLPKSSLTAGMDDAAFLDTESSELPRVDKPYIVVSFSPATGQLRADEYFCHVAKVLDELAEVSGARIVFVPHMDSKTARDQDLRVHEQLVANMRTANLQLLEVLPAKQAASLTASASMVVTSRYHPAVFAAAAGVPTVALSTDYYSHTRLSGALGNWGLASFELPLASLLTGGFREAVIAGWDQRSKIAAHLRNLRRGREGEFQAWWDAVVLTLQGEPAPAPPNLSPAGEYICDASWTKVAQAVRTVSNNTDLRLDVAELELQRERDLRQIACGERDTARTEIDRLLKSRAFRVASSAWRVTSKFKRLDRSGRNTSFG